MTSIAVGADPGSDLGVAPGSEPDVTLDLGLDLAVRAANLAERTEIVARLHEQGRRFSDVPGPDAFDTWRIETLARKLAAKFDQEALHRTGSRRRTAAEIAGVLEHYRRFQIAVDQAAEVGAVDAADRELLQSRHASWLPTYRAALTGLRPDGRSSDTAPDVERHYGRLAIAAAPFLEHLTRVLDAELDTLNQGSPLRIDRNVVADLGTHLLERFELSLAWAVETDAKVYAAQNGIDLAQADRDQYLGYLDATFADADACHSFYLRFPVLGRWLARVTALVCELGRELLHRLAADAADLATILPGPVGAITGVRPGRSDVHAGGRTVAMVNAELVDGTAVTFVYKPRDVTAEASTQRLLARLVDDGVLAASPRAVLSRDGYGYEALIPSGRNRVDDLEQVRQVYRELGGYLAFFYVLGGGDLHLENILVADGHAHVCDCETVLGVLPTGQTRPLGTLLDSVFKTGLLEWPQPGADGSAETMRISGYSGGEAYEMPIAVPMVNDRRLSFEAAVTHRSGIRVEPNAANRVFLGEQLIQPQDHAADITAGFEAVYNWFEQRPEQAAAEVAEVFTGAPIRFINWGTQVYSQLLMSARHPRCLMEPLEVDLLFNTVRTFPRTWDANGVLADRELSSMWQLDVPIFTANAHGRQLVHDHVEALPSPLDISPVGYAQQRIRGLSEQNRDQQRRYIAASLSTAEISSPAFVETCVDYAAQIGERLCEQLRDPGASAPWTSYDLVGEQMAEVDVEADLYHGSAGIALFLAYLDALRPNPRFRAAAEQALRHAEEACDHSRPGAFQGIGGLIYLLTHLATLWQDPTLRTRADELAAELPSLIEADRRYDVLSGSAGLIPVLLGLAGPDGDRARELARICGEHLLQGAEADGDTLSWPLTDPSEAVANLTGFSHGTAGIGWALVMLGQELANPDLITAGQQAFAYETKYFDSAEQDWYDLRKNSGGTVRNGRHYANAWCNGAAGIGLSRITTWDRLGRQDEKLLREAHQALAATMRNFPQLRNDTLCHGRSGNAELLLRFGLVHEEPAFQLEANVQVQSQWRAVDEALSGAADGSAGFFPGLMLGMSGFGLHFLRLARPELVPSVLLLDPPAETDLSRTDG